MLLSCSWGGLAAGVWALLLCAGLWLALLIDHLWGEPPPRWHPVVWLGQALDWFGRRIAPAQQGAFDCQAFGLGALAWCALAAMVFVLAWGLQGLVLQYVTPWLAAPLLGLWLKPLLAWRMLRSEVLAVDAALQHSLAAGRQRLSYLVSRDTGALSAEQVRESALESLAENLNDSVVAPVFWFLLLGLPGAAVYRFANTADAMWGYTGMRGGRYWRWAGCWAARADDVLSWLPARLTALLLVLAAGRWPEGLRQQARQTPSPNSGWPMAAMALLLGLRLSKPGVYCLHPDGQAPTQAHVQQALVLGSKVVVMLAGIALAALFLIVWMTAF